MWLEVGPRPGPTWHTLAGRARSRSSKKSRRGRPRARLHVLFESPPFWHGRSSSSSSISQRVPPLSSMAPGSADSGGISVECRIPFFVFPLRKKGNSALGSSLGLLAVYINSYSSSSYSPGKVISKQLIPASFLRFSTRPAGPVLCCWLLLLPVVGYHLIISLAASTPLRSPADHVQLETSRARGRPSCGATLAAQLVTLMKHQGTGVLVLGMSMHLSVVCVCDFCTVTCHVCSIGLSFSLERN